MTKKKLIKLMIEVEKEEGNDWEVLHSRHDDLLLEYINDKEVTKVFDRTTKWCA